MNSPEEDLLKLRSFLGDSALWELEEGSLVALPSVSLGSDHLISEMGSPRRFDERLLFLSLLLSSPGLSLIYVTSQPLADDVIDHYLSLLPDLADARRRLRLVALDDARHKPLAQKLLSRRDALAAILASVTDHRRACIVPMDVTPDELAISHLLGLPLFGPAAEFSHLGTKSGSRIAARSAGIPVLPGSENLCRHDEVREAIADLRQAMPQIRRVILKLDEGFSGEGNAVIDLTNETSDVLHGGGSDDWPRFLDKLQEGAIVEAFIDNPTLRCPSVQVSVSPGGRVDVLSTQEQVMGGSRGQAFVGCRFPSDEDYRAELHRLARVLAEHLCAEGVHGIFGFDFLVHGAPGEVDIYLCEVNLRMGGATAPCFLARLLTGGTYDGSTGLLHAGGKEVHYISREHVAAPASRGAAFSDLRNALEVEGLLFNRESMSGVWPHVCTTLDLGELGYVAIGQTPDEVGRLDSRMLSLVSAGSSIAVG